MAIHELFAGLKKIQDEEVHRQFPAHIRVEVRKANSGEVLAQLAYSSDGYLFHTDDSISPESKEIAAAIFDYLSDLGDVADLASFTEKLDCHRELDCMLKQLEELGSACYVASRATRIVGDYWVETTPVPFTIGYLAVFPVKIVLTEMMVPRRLS